MNFALKRSDFAKQISTKGIAIIALLVLLIGLIVAKEWWELLLLPAGLLVVWLTLYRLDWAMVCGLIHAFSVNLTDLLEVLVFPYLQSLCLC